MGSDLQFRDLANVLRRRRRLILAVTLCGTALICAVAFLLPPQYTAKAQMVIERQVVGLVGGQAAIDITPADESAILTEVAALTSHDHLQRVLDSVLRDPEFQAAAAPPEPRADATPDDRWHQLTAWIPLSWLPGTHESGNMTLRDLQRRLKVFQEMGSHVVAVSFTSPSPEAAAIVATRAIQLYVDSQMEKKRAYTDHALAWLAARMPELKGDVERFETAVQDYQSSRGLADTRRTAVIDQRLGDLNRQLAAAEADLAARQAQLARVRDVQHGGAGRDALAGSPDSQVLVDLQRQETALLQTQADLTTSFGEGHPKMQQIRAQLQAVRQKIGQQLERTAANLANDAQMAAARVQSTQQALANVQGASADIRLRELEREATSSRNLYDTLLQRREELQQQRETVSPGLRILSLASPPDRPSSPNPILFILPALIVSAIIGSLLALVLDRLDGTLRSERDVHDALGIPCIGLVPQLRRSTRRRPHQYLLDRPYAPYTEAIRSVVAALQLSAPSSASKVILISSSVPLEGKTTLAVSFAVYASQLGRSVVLVDLDFRHPAVLREIGGTAESGVFDLLLNDRPPSQVIQRLPGLDLDYLVVRRGPIDPLTLFASEHMSRLLRQLREKYDCVVIDSAPLLAITEARLLASMVDKVLFVVKWGKTRRDVAQNALALLRSTGCLDKGRSDLAGAVIMQVNLKKHARYRYGDSGEFFMRYKKYYSETPLLRDY
ncbi:GumC family protein [Limobrevibacterium gyesilva]|uniref:non-specific protein-tyrosine kinase n=1 Tax=Limobrevibacterium gyesilva TaxID=2991712 RepID=A0AA42CDF5_9PROT|nr:polysaccharide biosynthesis tyrosine autokinase [Limobrevibacterium gyesilva]MCW3474798.1 polysaccharide biosynthesis tyrosine autokinase [Limobrevibacterium gyesilva]